MRQKHVTTRRDNGTINSNWLDVSALAALLAVCAGCWLTKVNSIVPEPYLDEVFHVRQAQVYCAGNLRIWDPKITTPPGLYLVSYMIYRLTGRCSIEDLRALNVFTIVIGYLYTYGILCSLRSTSASKVPRDRESLTALNIWLFPPLFFFSGLYYTDVQSAFWVLLTFQSYLRYERNGFKDWSDAFSQFKFGIIALFFRQTNIFWVAIFPAGLSLIASAQSNIAESEMIKQAVPVSSVQAILQRSWTESNLYDPPVFDAKIEEYAVAAVSLLVVSLRNVQRSISILVPYLALLACFCGFVIWNGGVVLGDKSNHVATIHVPQMLYLWPYMLFFSWPLIVRSVFQGNIKTPTSASQIMRTTLLLGTLSATAGVVIYYNTIVHPFTLADNRHYVFYVFRILMRHPAIKYFAAPMYAGAGYFVIQALGSRSHDTGCRASFVLVWFVTTALSLITAPLVEPRYCILPWMMWRLYAYKAGSRPVADSTAEASTGDRHGLVGLATESLWFLAIFAGTAYMFLFRGFSWPQEVGKTQRFLW